MQSSSSFFGILIEPIISALGVSFRGGFRGGADAPPPSGIRPPADPEGPAFDTF